MVKKIIKPNAIWLGCWSEPDDMATCGCERCLWNLTYMEHRAVREVDGRIVGIL